MAVKYRIMHVGCGGMGNAWIGYVTSDRNDCEIVALVDIVPDHAENYKEKYNLSCPVFDHIDKALAAIKPNLIIDTTTPDAHCEIRTKAMEHGIPVIGEKPLADTLDEAYKIVETADKTGMYHYVMQNRRYLPSMRKMHDLAHSETLGKVGLLVSQFFIEAHFGGFRDLMDNVLILDMAVHTFDQARMIIGSDPVSVFCNEFNLPGSWYKGNASTVCVFEFENGVVYTYIGSWSSKGFNTSWEADWRMVCENGTVMCDGNSEPVMDYQSSEGMKRETVPFDYEGRHGHQGCFDAMFKAMEENKPAETDCHDNIKTMKMVFGAIESVKTGKKISLK